MLFLALAVTLAACPLAAPLSRLVGRQAGAVLALPLLLSAALLLAGGSPHAVVEQWLPWMPSLGVGLGLRLDGLGLVFSLLVLVVGAGVMLYSTRYLGRERTASFYVLMTAFAAAMLLLVLSDDLVVMFVAWEATTFCSFFLIARSGEGAREPAIRTLLVTAAGGLSLLAAVVVMIVVTGTTRLSEVLAHPVWGSDAAFTVLVAVLLAVAAFTKSAQFPFQSWLPDSMVAITPVSTYLHAAAMVKAGIYLLLRFSPALADVAVWNVLLVSCGLTTALLGAVSALRRHDLKELLAYSTMSQLGLLVAMIGVGTPAALTAAVVHTVAHAVFKSALFMLVGVVDHEAGTRDMRRLAGMRLRMPATAAAMGLAAASMAGVPLLLGFISKESMFAALIESPWGPGLAALMTAAAALTSVFTVAYSARLVLGAFSGRGDRLVREASPLFWGVPALAAAASLALGAYPAPLDAGIGGAASVAAGSEQEVHLALWHGLNAELAVSAVVIALGVALVLGRRRVDVVLAPLRSPVSGLGVVDALRAGLIRGGGVVGGWSGSTSPRRHLAVPAVCLALIALVGLPGLGELPPVAGDRSRPWDWALVALLAAGVIAAVRVRTRIAAVVVTGVVGFSMMLWFFVLGAVDVAVTQLLVEVLTVCVMVLLLKRLPARFARQTLRRRIPAAVIALAAGLATALGVWALTGRRGLSPAAEYYLREGYEATGGSNIVNTILVDFRALDTLGELTVLGVAGVAIVALLRARPLAASREVDRVTGSPLEDAWQNGAFLRTATRVIGPIIVVMSVVLLFRGHYEPGGGFIAALVGGAGFALLYLAAPRDHRARIRWPYLLLIGLGVVLGTGTGLLGYLEGSFLKPLGTEVLGVSLSTPLLFDVGVYLAVIGVILASLNKLGRDDPDPAAEPPQDPDAGDAADAPGRRPHTPHYHPTHREVKTR
ncbi:DUF4040 family protein [Rothia sp. AR01]|uniref:DUF4040 family protein n=1 Tax=Rothia santali TaxID=2949643 RepID=A0A9X2KIA4_9MICC|nr:DUF4040 family protein [Rothia santali]MCP3425664.1 DUF4040 family protein [Rothia santali]